jgi:hypothetical protein
LPLAVETTKWRGFKVPDSQKTSLRPSVMFAESPFTAAVDQARIVKESADCRLQNVCDRMYVIEWQKLVSFFMSD